MVCYGSHTADDVTSARLCALERGDMPETRAQFRFREESWHAKYRPSLQGRLVRENPADELLTQRVLDGAQQQQEAAAAAAKQAARASNSASSSGASTGINGGGHGGMRRSTAVGASAGAAVAATAASSGGVGSRGSGFTLPSGGGSGEAEEAISKLEAFLETNGIGEVETLNGVSVPGCCQFSCVAHQLYGSTTTEQFR